MFGLSVAIFAVTSQLLGFYYPALSLMFFMGIFDSTYMISVQSSLQMLVPDRMRGRIMGFYGMTWSIMPLSGLQAGALAYFIGTPLAVMIGGPAVAAFAVGPALLNSKLRGLATLLERVETTSTEPKPSSILREVERN